MAGSLPNAQAAISWFSIAPGFPCDFFSNLVDL
jgi:hypothetical protein